MNKKERYTEYRNRTVGIPSHKRKQMWHGTLLSGKFLFVPVLYCLMLCCCQKDKFINSLEQNENPVPDIAYPLSLSVDIADRDVTRGLAPITGSNLNNLGVFAGFEQTADFGETSVPNNYLNNTIYSREKLTGKWGWDNPTYWPMIGRLSFFVYTPYISNLRLVNTNGIPSIRFSPESDVSNQMDFCLAEPHMNCADRTQTIYLQFHHTLTGISLSMNYIGTLPSDQYYVKIDRIILDGLIGTKTVRFLPESPYFTWNDDTNAERITSYTITRQRNSGYTQIFDTQLPVRNPENDNHIQINTDLGKMFLLPQQLSGATIRMTYGFYVNKDKETLLMQFETEAELPNPTDGQWNPGINVSYRATLDVGHSRILNIAPEESSKMIEKYVDDTMPTTIEMIE